VTSSPIRLDREHDETYWPVDERRRLRLNPMIGTVALRAASAYGWDAALVRTARGLRICLGDV
jgi:hypothetical protein